MQRWMIWAGAGVIGILLAILAIPWAMVSIDSPSPTPTIDPPLETSTEARTPTPTASTGPQTFADPEPTPATADDAGGSADVAKTSAAGSDATADETRPDNRFVERRSQPDVRSAARASSRWSQVIRMSGKKEDDPLVEPILDRVSDLQDDLAEFRRHPDDQDYADLVSRQRHILGEMKQTSHWGQDMQIVEAQLEESFATYEDAQ